ncbi:MAG: efflux RND transporter permease subunit [Gammaproteobacteria bacterium]|nr:efflux RND transporter permease subunit [Gammaproteobacteria bacterium]
MKIVDIATDRRVTIFMITLAVIIFGFVSYSRLNLNLLPELSYPTVTVRTELQGAAPLEIENLITKPIEEMVGTIKGIRNIRSISRSGQSDVTLEFTWGTNMDYAGVDIREKLDQLTLPLDAERPVLLRFDPSTEPVMRYGFRFKDDAVADLSGEEKLKQLRRFADEQLVKELESIEGVAAVKASGGLEDEIQILVDEDKLAQLKLPISTVAERLRAENVNLSGGRLKEGGQQFLVRTINEFESVEAIGESIVATRDGRPVYVKDIAEVRRGFKEREAITRINGEQAVEIAIYKEGDSNTVSVAGNVDRRVARVAPQLPSDMEMTKVYDQSVFISQAIDEVVNAAIIGGILAALVIYFFLQNFWATLVISVAIPVSIIGTFIAMFMMEISLNIMSLGGIALAVGLLVDNAIVTLENISRHREKGEDVLTAARRGTGEIGTAIVASTLTTIAVFFPLVFVQGIAGQLFGDQAWTITWALLISLVVALTLIPMLSSLRAPSRHNPELPDELEEPWVPKYRVVRWFLAIFKGLKWVFTTIAFGITWVVLRIGRGFSIAGHFLFKYPVALFQWLYERLDQVYRPTLSWSLRHRAEVLVIAIAVFMSSLLLVPRLGVELIPQLSQGEFHVEIEMEPGTPLEETDAAVAAAAQAAEAIPGVAKSYAVAGTGNRLDANPAEAGENTGKLNVVMNPGATRADEERAMDELRNTLDKRAGLDYTFGRPELFTFSTPLEVEVTGYDLSALRETARMIVNAMEESDRYTDVASTIEQGHPEIQIRFDHERAAQLGLVVADIADTVVDKVRGEVATKYSWRDRKIDVLVRNQEEQRASIEEIRNLIVNPESDRPLTLSAVADVTVAMGPAEIRRRGQQRVALITANTAYGDLGTAVAEIEDTLARLPLSPLTTVQVTGQSEDMEASFTSMQFAIALAIFLVYLVMASQFESLLHPFVILFSIPLALTGAIVALFVTGSTISVVVFIGLMMLAGIVVNNAIVLVDMINQQRDKGMPRQEAIAEAGRSRLRPIIMTMMTTVLGLMPMAIGVGEGGEIRAPMAITVIGGLLVSTLLTLVVIPVVYAVMDEGKERLLAVFRKQA